MIELFVSGLLTALNPFTLILMFIGTAVGIVFGAVPGLSTVMGLVLGLPFTYTMSPAVGICFLISLYIGGTSGGLISAILIGIPGTPASIATCFDGLPMKNKGFAMKALGLGVVFSFIGTVFSTLALVFVSPLLAKIALQFGPHEYFAISIFAIILITTLSGSTLPKSFFATFMGMAFATVGLSPTDAVKRFTFDNPQLVGGFNTLTVLIGLFAITEIIVTAENIKYSQQQEKITINTKVKGFGFSMHEFFAQKWNAFVSAVIGTLIGILPGIGGSTSNLIAYNIIKSRSKYPEKYGTGIPDGIVASETSNNASVGGAMIPLLTLGIPGDGATAVLLGAFMVHGITPGPLLFKNNASLVFAIFAAMFIGAFLMLIVEFFGLRIFAHVLRVPKHILLPVVIVFTTVGAFALASRTFDVVAILVFGILGYIFAKFKVPQSPFIIGFILGKMTEENLRRGLILSNNNILNFFGRPIACIFLVATIAYLLYLLVKYFKESKKVAQI